MSKRLEFTDEEKNLIYNLYYVDKKSIKEIGNVMNVSATGIINFFIRNNWKRRNRSEHLTKYSVDDHCFDKPEKAYCLGLFYSDGCNHYNEHDISIELQARDIEVLQKINTLIHNTRDIYYYSSENNKYRTQDTTKLLIHSEHMCDVMNNYGFVPRKSLVLQYPYWMDKEFIPFMLRGYIDGDGWIQKYNIGFMSTKDFCIGVQDYLLQEFDMTSSIYNMNPKKYKDVTKSLYIFNRDKLKNLSKLMFSACDIYIDRKREKYFEYGFLDTDNSITV